MSFTVKSLGKLNEVTNVDSAGEATDVVSDLQKRAPGAVKVEIHHDEDADNTAASRSGVEGDGSKDPL